MFSNLKPLITSIAACAFLGFAAHADGVYPMFNDAGDYIDDIEIIGDVFLPSGEEMVALEMRGQNIKLYIPPDGIYVTLDLNNPLFKDNPPFYGYWFSTQSANVGNWPVCAGTFKDEYDAENPVHGVAVWTNTGLTEDYDLGINVFFESCDPTKYIWLFNEAYTTINNASAVPHGDIPDQNQYTVVDGNGDAFFMEILDGYAVLTSMELREIKVELATDPVTYETFTEQEVILMNSDCSTSSQHHGYGTWAWANGGFTIDFADIGFSFPKMDGPPVDNSACRM